MRFSTIKAKNIKVGYMIDGKLVESVRITDKGNVSFKLKGVGWKRRSGEERISVTREA